MVNLYNYRILYCIIVHFQPYSIYRQDTSIDTEKLLIEKIFLLHHPCKLIASLYLRIIDKLIKKQEFIDNILKTIKQIDVNLNLEVNFYIYFYYYYIIIISIT